MVRHGSLGFQHKDRDYDNDFQVSLFHITALTLLTVKHTYQIYFVQLNLTAVSALCDTPASFLYPWLEES